LAAVGVLALLKWSYGTLASDFKDVAPDRLSSETGGRPQAEVLAAHLGVPLIEGNPVELLLNGVEIFPAMLSAIEHAETSINLLSYVYWQGDIAREFADALSAAARSLQPPYAPEGPGGRWSRRIHGRSGYRQRVDR
jgi:cardiolipin synthase